MLEILSDDRLTELCARWWSEYPQAKTREEAIAKAQLKQDIRDVVRDLRERANQIMVHGSQLNSIHHLRKLAEEYQAKLGGEG